MDNTQIRRREVQMSKDNAVSVVKKILAGSCMILMVGLLAYILLFFLLLII